jgi:cytochrome c peroxidase
MPQSLRRPAALLSVLAVLVTPIGAIADDAASVPVATLQAQYRRPDTIPFPAANPYTDAKAQLGQTLFFDPRLSGPGTLACAGCHNPGLGWKDGLARGVGFGAKQLARATPTIVNLAWADLLMWDGSKDGLEDQALGPNISETEMNMPMPVLLSRLSAIPGYRRRFAEAFGQPAITPERVAQAIATFERTVVSNKAPFDRWIAGDEAAIDEPAKRGFVLFNTRANCAACHSTWRFTDDGFHDIGLPGDDPGRGAQVPDEPALAHAFKTPTLRDIDLRAPYMHDGSIATLRAVVQHYDSGFTARPSLSPEMHRLGLAPRDIDDIVAFLHTLTSQDDPVVVPVMPAMEED